MQILPIANSKNQFKGGNMFEDLDTILQKIRELENLVTDTLDTTGLTQSDRDLLDLVCDDLREIEQKFI